MRDRWGTRFDRPTDPMAHMGNLVDVMLVFACGLIAALLSRSPAPPERPPTVEEVKRGRELPRLPDGISGAGAGYESVGTVVRDPQTGKLLLIGR